MINSYSNLVKAKNLIASKLLDAPEFIQDEDVTGALCTDLTIGNKITSYVLLSNAISLDGAQFYEKKFEYLLTSAYLVR